MLKLFKIEAYDEVPSTNDIAKELWHAGRPEGTVITANVQTRGRGRMGRRWISPTGNLYCSVILKPKKPIRSLSELSFVAALAVGETIADFFPEKKAVTYKWPNDVLVGGQKIAGILLETEGSQPDAQDVIVGVGINCASYPDQVTYPATSLADWMGTTPDPKNVLSDFLKNLRLYYNKWLKDGFSVIRPMWLEKAHGMGGKITLAVNGRVFTGAFLDINDRGELLVRNYQGEIDVISSAEVLFA